MSDDFIRTYRERAAAYPKPSVTVDLVVFTVHEESLRLLIIERGEPPYKGEWALPGGFVKVGNTFDDQGESLEAAARRELAEETTVDLQGAWLEQVGAFGDPGRDPRMRVISVAYTALLRPDLADAVRGGSDAAKAVWVDVGDTPELAFDHGAILSAAHTHLQRRLADSAIAFQLVPERFTIGDLRTVWAAVLKVRQDPGNFRRRFVRMMDDGIIQETPRFRPTNTKPARLYTFAGPGSPGQPGKMG